MTKMVLLIVLCLFSSYVYGTFESHAEIGAIAQDGKFVRSLRDTGPDAGKKYEMKPAEKKEEFLSEYDRAVQEEKEADNSLVGSFSPDPYPHLNDGVTKNIGLRPFKKSAYEATFTDEYWKDQWYMHDYRKTDGPVMDLNIVPVHRMGYTGEGITVAVVDSGVNMKHPDLIENLDTELQYSVSDNSKNANPYKHFWQSKANHHGTESAGIIGMTANNSICGAGMAHKAKIVAINADKLVDTGYYGSKALIHALDKVDIYSNSWGPDDTGSYLKPINKHVATAIDQGIREGRGRKGAIYTFAGGNGRKSSDDNCSADDIVNYIHTIGIGAANKFGKRAEYSEACSALFATTYSGEIGSESVVTTTGASLFGVCTRGYLGTSAATPQASAIIALVLQANKGLTYRDVMHVITMGAEVAPLADNDSWYQNGAGFWVSNEFGFGLMNAYNMVRWAIDWVNVPKKMEPCEVQFEIKKDIKFRVNEPAHLTQWTGACPSSEVPNMRVRFLEQVILTSSVKHRFRGAVSITLTSPRGTKTEIMTPRKRDMKHRGLRKWQSKSVHNWGEDPKGEWKIDISAAFMRTGLSKAWENMYQTFIKPMTFRMPDFNETGTVHSFTLWLHGTSEEPDHHKKRLVPRTYSAFRTRQGQKSDPLTVKQRRDGGLSTHELHPSQAARN